MKMKHSITKVVGPLTTAAAILAASQQAEALSYSVIVSGNLNYVQDSENYLQGSVSVGAPFVISVTFAADSPPLTAIPGFGNTYSAESLSATFGSITADANFGEILITDKGNNDTFTTTVVAKPPGHLISSTALPSGVDVFSLEFSFISVSDAWTGIDPISILDGNLLQFAPVMFVRANAGRFGHGGFPADLIGSGTSYSIVRHDASPVPDNGSTLPLLALGVGGVLTAAARRKEPVAEPAPDNTSV